MAHFIGYLTGRSRTRASRLGTKSTGLTARAQGWNIGARVELSHGTTLKAEGDDIVSLYLTGGSNGSAREQYIGSWRRTEDGYEPCTSIGTTKG